MAERIRVRDNDTGYHRTIDAASLPHGNYTVLKGDAVDPRTGDDVPPKFDAARTSEPPSGRQADTQKEKN